jgi:hypothetical protein
MKNVNILILAFYIILSLLLTSYILGFDNISFISSKWLAAHDVTTDIISWKFFKDDIWRFPLGSNPNYGMDIGSGIAFSGSIPIMAIFFKLFANILPDNFHYFSLWIFICFFLQSYIAFLIIHNQTKNLYFSIVGSLFFLLSPPLINRLSFHLSLCAHWLILMGFYIETKKDLLNKNIYWAALISLSTLIHFYFTIMLLGIFFLFLLSNFKNDLQLKKFYSQLFVVLGSLTFTMFMIGYFDVPFVDALAYGYGNYALDISSLFNSNTAVINGGIDWSFFLENKTVLPPEGFAYLGIGGIFLLIYMIVILIYNFKNLIKKNYFLPIFFIILIFIIVGLTNKIHLFNNIIFDFELPTIVYGILSIVRASGRLVWPVYYLIFLISIIFLYKNFSKKNSFYILTIIFTFQFIDIYPGLKKHYNSNAFINEKKLINYSFWKDVTKKNPILRTTYLNNETKFLVGLREVLLLKNIKKTDISTHGRYNRKQASISRSSLYRSFDEKKIPKNTIFAVDNFNHLRTLKYLFENEDIGFFFKDNKWIIISGYAKQMTDFDLKELKKYKPTTIKKNKKIYLNFDDENSIHGIGWTHNRLSTKKGIWTEGNISNLIFKLEGNIDDNFTIRIKLSSIITKKNESLNFNVNINNSFIKEFNVKNINELNEESIFINLNKNNIKDDIIYIKFEIKNPVTKLELLKSPDARKLGILVESLEIINN